LDGVGIAVGSADLTEEPPGIGSILPNRLLESIGNVPQVAEFRWQRTPKDDEFLEEAGISEFGAPFDPNRRTPSS
jgi:hypothetical protein